ncbi:MAG: dihydroneopterin aldolase [Candidatus Anaerobiospirillum merdipullorum]|uniref:dihydroneopterin aldolase n=1 Tax=Candidatus Anaerobiospirillum merdipullorum TaxID=2838450 RepID=A0A9E2KP21_9GAMM|nr:dihydroneopterin aldolase [Candidatus Anaerobiospirillum merdipullorum]
MSSQIFIHGLKVNCIIGIYPHERVNAQELIIDVSLQCPTLEQAGRQGDLSLSLDYAAIAQDISNFVVKRQARLLEELAVELADLILARYPAALAVTLRLTKTQAVPHTVGTGIEFCKTR